eukprot:172435-Chlamydomonas_euryale.AAC.1
MRGQSEKGRVKGKGWLGHPSTGSAALRWREARSCWSSEQPCAAESCGALAHDALPCLDNPLHSRTQVKTDLLTRRRGLPPPR